MKQLRSHLFVTTLAAAAVALVTAQPESAKAQMKCSVSIEIVKAGFIVRAGGESGTL